MDLADAAEERIMVKTADAADSQPSAEPWMLIGLMLKVCVSI